MGRNLTKFQKLEEGHHRLYYEGTKAVEEGRYCNSELYFQQALEMHAGNSFWRNLHKSIHSPCTIPRSNDDASESSKNVLREKEIELRLDQHLTCVLDYIRLSMDIALTYMKQKQDERNVGIALHYCAIISIYIQELWILVEIWEKEHQHELTGSENSLQCETLMDKITITPSDVAHTLHLLKIFLRYYWNNAATNYMVLCLQFTRTLSPTEEKQRQNIISNCLLIANRAQYELNCVALTLPTSPTARIILEMMPEVEHAFFQYGTQNLETPFPNRGPGSSPGSDLCWPSLLESNLKVGGIQAFLYQAKSVCPAQKIIVDFSKCSLPQLYIPMLIPKKTLTSIRSPAQRNTFDYISWFFSGDVFMVPGSNAYYLSQEPNNTRRKASEDDSSTLDEKSGKIYSTISIYQRNTRNELCFDFNLARLPASTYSNNTSKHMYPIDTRNNIIDNKLDLFNAHTLQVLELEEAVWTTFPLLIITAKILTSTNQVARGKSFVHLAKKTAETMYGLDSTEYIFANSLYDICTAVF